MTNHNRNPPSFWGTALRLLGREPCPGTMQYDYQIKRFVCDQCPRVHWVNSPNHMRDTRHAR